MAILAFKTSSYRNAVSKLHRVVSQDMWQNLWPQLPVNEVPITSITNGVHLPTWLNGDLAMLYDQYLQPDWRERYLDPKIWDLVADIPDQELWEAHRRRKRQAIMPAPSIRSSRPTTACSRALQEPLFCTPPRVFRNSARCAGIRAACCNSRATIRRRLRSASRTPRASRSMRDRIR